MEKASFVSLRRPKREGGRGEVKLADLFPSGAPAPHMAGASIAFKEREFNADNE